MANTVPGSHSTNPLSQGQTGVTPQVNDDTKIQQQQKVISEEQEQVTRGYSQTNTVSTQDGKEEKGTTIKAQHNLDEPEAGTETASEKVLKEFAVMEEFQKTNIGLQNIFKNGGLTTDSLAEASFLLLGDISADLAAVEGEHGQGLNPFFSTRTALQERNGHLVSLGFDQQMLDGIQVLTDPNNQENSLKDTQSVSSRLDALLAGDTSVEKLNSLVGNVFNKLASLESGPEELISGLNDQLKGITSQYAHGKQHIDIDLVIETMMKIQSDMQNNRLQYSQIEIKANDAERQRISKQRIETLMKEVEKRKEADKANPFQKIFGWVTVAAAAIATVALVATGVGSGLAVALMFAATALMITMQASAETGDWLMNGVAKAMVAMGVPEEYAEIAAMAAITVIIIVLSIGGAAAASGASGAANVANTAAKGASAAAGGASSGASVAASASTAASAAAKATKFTQVANRVSQLARGVGGVTMIADGSVTAYTTTLNYEADKFKAEAKELFAFMLKNQHVIDDLVEDVRKVIDDMQQVWQIMTGIMKDNHDTKSRLNAAIKG